MLPMPLELDKIQVQQSSLKADLSILPNIYIFKLSLYLNVKQSYTTYLFGDSNSVCPIPVKICICDIPIHIRPFCVIDLTNVFYKNVNTKSC